MRYRALVIGLGSMGKRRVRNLLALGFPASSIAGFDLRADRAAEAREKYGIDTGTNVELFLEEPPDHFFISTPPDRHLPWLERAVSLKRPAFVEASVILDGLPALLVAAREATSLVAPSYTMHFFPGPTRIRALISEGAIGAPLFFTYQSGQYLPDWHPWEDIRDYYVSNPATGGCREIVPFELGWLMKQFGEVSAVRCFKDKRSGLDAPIDDVYQMIMRFDGGVLGHLTVDVLSRPAVRHLRIVGTEGWLEWDQTRGVIRVSTGDAIREEPLDRLAETGGTISPDEPYIEEVRRFLDAAAGRAPFGNTLEEDIAVLEWLERAEASASEV